MRGRVQASAIALLGTLLPLITPAVVALVTLRKGSLEGTLILSVGLLPTLLTLDANHQGQSLVVLSTVFGLIAVYLSALVLRQTASWAVDHSCAFDAQCNSFITDETVGTSFFELYYRLSN